jgi:N-acetylmuramic acid 6-phosphate etherase
MRRAVRIVMLAAGADEDTARTALDETGWHAKLAIAVITTGMSVADARAALDAAGGVLRKVIEPAAGSGRR